MQLEKPLIDFDPQTQHESLRIVAGLGTDAAIYLHHIPLLGYLPKLLPGFASETGGQ